MGNKTFLVPFMTAVCGIVLLGSLHMYRIRKYKLELRRLGEEIDRILHGNELLDPGSYKEGEVAVLRDEVYKMTVRLREQSERLVRDKEFLADSLTDISHQIRTPLTTLNIMTARLMQKGEDPEYRNRTLRDMNRMLERIDWLVTALLKLSRLDAGAVELEPVEIDMKVFLQKALEPFAIQMEIRGQDCMIQGAEDIRFLADEAWTLEAVRNVLKNSLEYTPDGSCMEIICTGNPLYAEIAVCDRGPGIEETDLPHLFERFYKGSHARSSSFGIGLALARTIMGRQNGSIHAENRNGGGSCFRLRFYRQNV